MHSTQHTRRHLSATRKFAIGGMILALAGCSTIMEKTSVIPDTELIQKSAAALGYAPDELILTKRTMIGGDTYANLQAKKGRKEFTCVIVGGGILAMGMTSPPSCSPKGSAINTSPFQQK